MRFAIAALVLFASPAFAQSPRVVTQSGPVVGEASAGVASFKGIPYAAPPVGELRWAAPQPAIAWTADRSAAEYGPSCMQARAPGNADGGRSGEMSEDCLTLNVWAPQKAVKAPVILWLHGGGHVAGGSGDKYSNGAGFAGTGVVLVSANYRLGALGYFSQPALGADANFGLLDQIAALQWVKANIAAFGGDPGNVTIMGESSGGQDVLALMVSPLAKGLFSHAISQSPPGIMNFTSLAEAQKRALEVAKAAGMTGPATAKALRALPAAALAEAGTRAGLDLVVDGRSLIETPLAAFVSGREAQVPLLIGTNSGEGSLVGETPKPEEMVERVTPDDLGKLRSLYGADGAALARKIFRDAYFTGPVLTIAKAHEKAGQAVYVYRFDYRMSVLRSRRPDAYHGSEIPFVFGTLPPQAAAVEDGLTLAELHDCWAAFATTGAPTCQWSPGWAKGSATWMVFDDQGGADKPIGSTEAIDLLSARL